MRTPATSFLMGLVVAGGVAFGVAAFAREDPASLAKRKRKPTEVNIVESIPLEISSTLPATVDIQTIPPVAISSLPATTHVGRPPADLVVLNLTTPMTAPKFVRCHDDGTIDATEFAVPAGMKLVVTDVDWLVSSSGAGSYLTLRVFIENKTSSSRCLAYINTGSTTEINTGSGFSPVGFASGLHTGFVVGTGARVVADVRKPPLAGGGDTTLAPFTESNAMIVLRGYLVTAP